MRSRSTGSWRTHCDCLANMETAVPPSQRTCGKITGHHSPRGLLRTAGTDTWPEHPAALRSEVCHGRRSCTLTGGCFLSVQGTAEVSLGSACAWQVWQAPAAQSRPDHVLQGLCSNSAPAKWLSGSPAGSKLCSDFQATEKRLPQMADAVQPDTAQPEQPAARGPSIRPATSLSLGKRRALAPRASGASSMLPGSFKGSAPPDSSVPAAAKLRAPFPTVLPHSSASAKPVTAAQPRAPSSPPTPRDEQVPSAAAGRQLLQTAQTALQGQVCEPVCTVWSWLCARHDCSC